MWKFLLFTTLFISQLSFAKMIVVSDLDETLRISKSHSLANAVLEISKGVKPFPIMQKIFSDLHNEGAQFFYVTAASTAYYDASAWLNKHHFPKGPVFQKKISESTSTYKYQTISKLLSEIELTEGDTLFLFGDNASKDEVVYTRVKSEFFRPKTLIFIRDIRAQATVFAEQLQTISIVGPHYFFTEYELLSSDILTYVTESSIQQILANYRNKVIFSPSPEIFLAKRIKNEICEKIPSRNEEEKCEKGAREWANTLIGNYFF